jgi:hypothetical protein
MLSSAATRIIDHVVAELGYWLSVDGEGRGEVVAYGGRVTRGGAKAGRSSRLTNSKLGHGV